MNQLADDPTPEQAVDEWLSVRAMQQQESTVRNDTTRLNYFVEWCDEQEVADLSELTGRHLHSFVSWRREQISDLSLQKQLSSIREFLRWCDDVKLVDDGLAETVHAPDLPDGAESRDVHLTQESAERALDYLGTHHYGSAQHVALALAWRTGMRLSALRALDVDDYQPDEQAVEIVDRPEQGTNLKNDAAGERWVYLGRSYADILSAYITGPRIETTDEFGREPLLTTHHGRPSESTLYDWINAVTRPCAYGQECPHDRDPSKDLCGRRTSEAHKCPDSRSPHGVRRGAITTHLLDDVPPEVVSDRMDVSLEVLYRHYDARREDQKMNQRRRYLE